MAKIARANRATSAMISKPETSTFTLDDVRNGMKQLSADIKRPVSHVAVVHHETTTGCLNRLDGLRQAIDETADEIGATKPVRLIVDSMSAFGAQPVNMKELGIDFLVSSSNKCIEGVPGFSFALANKEALLEQGDDNARSLALDLRAQWEGLENNGQFRFTPPTHALLAFSSALGQLKAEGGPEARLARYQSNFDVLVDGLGRLGFNPLLEKSIQGPFIATFLVPDDPSWDFSTFYEELAARGLVIYPGKLTQSDCFRIGCIGQLQNDDMRTLVGAVEEVLEGMGVAMPVKQVALA